MATNKVGSNVGTKTPKYSNKRKVVPRDVLIGLLGGYVVGILAMMLIHLVIDKMCTNCTSNTSVEPYCFQGWILLARNKTCFYESYFYNWDNVSVEVCAFQVNEYFNVIETAQGMNDDVLIGALFDNDMGFYYWKSVASVNATKQATASFLNTCVDDLRGTAVYYGVNLAKKTTSFRCFM